jgi:Carboxypeptidase regulatory-like domain
MPTFLRTLRACLLALSVLVSAIAQTTGSIEGTVTDPTQLAIPNATVKVTQQQTGVVTTTTTNSSGWR